MIGVIALCAACFALGVAFSPTRLAAHDEVVFWRKRDAAKGRALKLIADGCSRPAKVAAAALQAERARREETQEASWTVQ